MVVHHTGGVIYCQTDLVLSLTGLGSPQPDLVFAELTCDVGDDFPHVQTLPCAIVPSEDQRNIGCGELDEQLSLSCNQGVKLYFCSTRHSGRLIKNVTSHTYFY